MSPTLMSETSLGLFNLNPITCVMDMSLTIMSEWTPKLTEVVQFKSVNDDQHKKYVLNHQSSYRYEHLESVLNQCLKIILYFPLSTFYIKNIKNNQTTLYEFQNIIII